MVVARRLFHSGLIFLLVDLHHCPAFGCKDEGKKGLRPSAAFLRGMVRTCIGGPGGAPSIIAGCQLSTAVYEGEYFVASELEETMKLQEGRAPTPQCLDTDLRQREQRSRDLLAPVLAIEGRMSARWDAVLSLSFCSTSLVTGKHVCPIQVHLLLYPCWSGNFREYERASSPGSTRYTGTCAANGLRDGKNRFFIRRHVKKKLTETVGAQT